MSRLLLIIPLCLSVLTSSALACGGEDSTDAEIAALTIVKEAQEKMASAFAQPVKIETIVRSGNDILNLDKRATVSAMCAANYINVYLSSKEPSELLCQLTFQVTSGEADFNGLRKGLVCRKANGAQPELVSLD